MKPIQIVMYATSTGKEPFKEWFLDLDKTTRFTISSRLARVENGNFGDCKPLTSASGIWEFKIDYGPGYRIYFGKQGHTIVILLMGGDKSTQSRDINKAEKYWLDHKESNT